MKVLVTGDRNWTHEPAIYAELSKLPEGTVVIHGDCRGADHMAAEIATKIGFETRAYPADWRKFPKTAGPIRNRLMLKEEHAIFEPIDLCLAFHNDIENSKGTKDMLSLVKKAGIKWKLITSNQEDP